MKYVQILRGLPSSGKSSWSKDKVLKSNCSIKRINKDDLRSMLDSGKHSKGNERFILELRDYLIVKALNDGKSVIVDDTNFEPVHEERIRNLVTDYNKSRFLMKGKRGTVEVKVKFFDVSPEECIARDLKRQNSVGQKVIMTMYNKYLKPKVNRIPKRLAQDKTLPKAIIVDIDGTVALNTGGRCPYDGTRVDEDTPNSEVVELVKKYLTDPNYYVIFLSGREGTKVCRELTEKWLDDVFEDVNSYNGYLLYMRAGSDNRKDAIIKQEIFEQDIKGNYYVNFVIDDRLQVCRMWHDLGLTLLRVGDPEADF